MGRVHHFTRSNEVGTLAQLVADHGFAYSYAMADLPSFAEFTALYRRFKLDKVSVRISLITVAGTATTVAYPTVLAAVDYTDQTVPAAATEMFQRRHVRYAFSPANTSMVIEFKPKRVDPDGAIFPGNVWQSLNSTATTYFGLKLWVENYNSTSNVGSALQLTETYFMSLSDER
jgi:hypothetical protein